MQTQYLQKPLHGYVSKHISHLSEIDQLKSKQRTCNKCMTTRFEAYPCAIQEQEIDTKGLISRRNKKSECISTIIVGCAKIKLKIGFIK